MRVQVDFDGHIETQDPMHKDEPEGVPKSIGAAAAPRYVAAADPQPEIFRHRARAYGTAEVRPLGGVFLSLRTLALLGGAYLLGLVTAYVVLGQ